jgi:glycosyltransferase
MALSQMRLFAEPSRFGRQGNTSPQSRIVQVIFLGAPLFSIITVSRNAAETIADCIESVQGQDRACEHIFIDGASEDDTKARILATAKRDMVMVSEPDNGMYDAMNKGIRLAKGAIIGILNSDDFYAHPCVLSKVVAAFENPEVDCCYGDLIMTAEARTDRVVRYWKAGPYDRRLFYRGWMPPHPTFFVRRRFYEELGGFRVDLGTAADYELMLGFLLKHGLRAAYLPERWW